MGFSGGGSNILKNHTHSAAVLQDGGNLQFDGVTEGNLSVGSITYSDGSNMQELVKPVVPGGQLLEFATAATAPSWGVPITNQDRLEQLASYETVNATTDTVVLTFSSIDLHDYASLYLTFSGVVVGALDLEVKMGAAVTSYRTNYDQSDTGTWTNVNGTSASEWKLADLDIGTWFQGQCFLFSRKSNENIEGYGMVGNVTCSAGSVSNSIAGGFTGSATSDITTVTIQTSTSYFEQYCRFNLMGLKRA